MTPTEPDHREPAGWDEFEALLKAVDQTDAIRRDLSNGECYADYREAKDAWKDARDALRAWVRARLAGPAPIGPESELALEILAELHRARTKFPGDNVTMLALMEEVGELAKATVEESRERVRREAVQVATMAMRVVLDGDSTLDGWRAAKGLDDLVPAGEG